MVTFRNKKDNSDTREVNGKHDNILRFFNFEALSDNYDDL